MRMFYFPRNGYQLMPSIWDFYYLMVKTGELQPMADPKQVIQTYWIEPAREVHRTGAGGDRQAGRSGGPQRAQDQAAEPARRSERISRSLGAVDGRRTEGGAPMLIEARHLGKTFAIGREKLRGPARPERHDRAGPLRLSARPERMRQEHVPALRRRPRAADERRTAGRRPSGRQAGPRSQHGVPGLRAVSLVHRRRERAVRPETAPQSRPGRRPARTSCARCWRLVGLTGFENAYPHQISGGMRQRVGLARALAVDPGALLMDEPFAAIDAITREGLQRELVDVWMKTGITIVFVTHSVDEATFLADEVHVFGMRPASIRYSCTIDLPRPRETASAAISGDRSTLRECHRRRHAHRAEAAPHDLHGPTDRRGDDVLLVVWELSVRLSITSSFVLAAPSTIVDDAIRLIASGELLEHISASMSRMLTGFALALVSGVVIGGLMGWFRWLDDIFDPLIELVRPVSPLAILPLAILWLGIGQASKVFVIWYGCLFPILLNTYAAVRGVPRSTVEAARTLGAQTDEMLRWVVFNHSIPLVLTGRAHQLRRRHDRNHRRRDGRCRRRPRLHDSHRAADLPHRGSLRRHRHHRADRFYRRPRDPVRASAAVPVARRERADLMFGDRTRAGHDVIDREPDGRFSAYLSAPPRAARARSRADAVHLRRQCGDACLADRFSAHGYVVVVPDLFWRQEPERTADG